MSLPKSLLSYQPQLDFMEVAMEKERGARLFVPQAKGEKAAEHFRMRCNYARVLHREENKKIHDEGEPLHGKSEYDILMFTVRVSPDGFWVYATKQFLDTSMVEDIPEDDYAPAIDASEIHLENEDDDVKTNT